MVGRPVKHTAPYFTHDADASAGKTLTILENHFGSDGYKAWFKLLENLASAENHFIDIRSSSDFDFLSGKMKFQPERLREIINKMADRCAIDKELWSLGIIWCQNFVDRLTPLYDKRKQTLPTRPDVNNLPPVSVPEIHRTCNFCGGNIDGLRNDALFCSDKCRLKGFRETDNETDNDPPKTISVPEMPISVAETPIPVTETPISVPEMHLIRDNKIIVDKRREEKRKGNSSSSIPKNNFTNEDTRAFLDILENLKVEIKSTLATLPESIDRLADHEAIKNKLAEIGKQKNYIPQSEYQVNGGRVDLVWKDDGGQIIFAFEIDYLSPKDKSIEKLDGLDCDGAFLILRGYALEQLIKGKIWIMGLGTIIQEEPDIFTLYEQEIGELTAGISQLIKDAEEEYTAPWVTGAIKVAVLNNKKSWSYIAGILRKCKEEGHPPASEKKGKTNDPDKYIKGKYGHVVQR